MISKWSGALRDHWQLWTCLRGWNQVVCIADDLAHLLRLPAQWLCDLHDRRLMRSMKDDIAFHKEQIQLAELGTTIIYETWPQWQNTSMNATTTLGDVKVTYKANP